LTSYTESYKVEGVVHYGVPLLVKQELDPSIRGKIGKEKILEKEDAMLTPAVDK
jgi:hypothetical protein